MTSTVSKDLGYALTGASGAQSRVSKTLGYAMTTTFGPAVYVTKALGYALIDTTLPNRHNSVYVNIIGRPGG